METSIEAYSPEWFKSRQGNFTGSEVWKLMTKPRNKSEPISKTAETYILEKVWEKLSGLTKGGVDNFATEWGNEYEPMAKQFYMRLTGNEITEAPLVYNISYDGLTGTPDGLIGGDGLIEVKCPFNGANHLRHCFITEDEYFKTEHPEYYWQQMSYMALTGRAWSDFVSFDPRINTDLGLFIYRLTRNDEDINELAEKVQQARELFNGYYDSFIGSYNTTKIK
jgi:hypothetical protein